MIDLHLSSSFVSRFHCLLIQRFVLRFPTCAAAYNSFTTFIFSFSTISLPTGAPGCPIETAVSEGGNLWGLAGSAAVGGATVQNSLVAPRQLPLHQAPPVRPQPSTPIRIGGFATRWITIPSITASLLLLVATLMLALLLGTTRTR